MTWRLRLTGGVSEQQLDLGAARLAGIELVGGASRTGLWLPPLSGALTVRMTGGVGELTVTVPGGPPARVRVAAGAGSVAVYDDHRTGVAPGNWSARRAGTGRGTGSTSTWWPGRTR